MTTFNTEYDIKADHLISVMDAKFADATAATEAFSEAVMAFVKFARELRDELVNRDQNLPPQ